MIKNLCFTIDVQPDLDHLPRDDILLLFLHIPKVDSHLGRVKTFLGKHCTRYYRFTSDPNKL